MSNYDHCFLINDVHYKIEMTDGGTMMATLKMRQ